MLENHKFDIIGSEIHFYPLFFSPDLRDLYLSQNSSQPFNEVSSPFWPLTRALAPQGKQLKIVNFLELNTSHLNHLDEENFKKLNFLSKRLICYEKLFLGTPRMVTGEGFGKRRKIWREIMPRNVDIFKNQVLSYFPIKDTQMIMCEDLKNNEVNGEVLQEYPKKPLLIFVQRKKRRRIINAIKLRQVMAELGFNVKEVLWEDFPLCEQILISRKADFMVGAHGESLNPKV